MNDMPDCSIFEKYTADDILTPLDANLRGWDSQGDDLEGLKVFYGDSLEELLDNMMWGNSIPIETICYNHSGEYDTFWFNIDGRTKCYKYIVFDQDSEGYEEWCDCFSKPWDIPSFALEVVRTKEKWLKDRQKELGEEDFKNCKDILISEMDSYIYRNAYGDVDTEF